MPHNPSDNISVYSRPRPVRVAFLIDTENCPDQLKSAVLDFNVKVWGGRFNPIIPVLNGDIPKGYWNLLSFFDPDIIYAYPKLSDNLIKKIDIKISPYYLKIHSSINLDPHYQYTPSIDEGFISPDLRVFPQGLYNPFNEKFSSLICHNRSDWEHYLFFQTNFGIFNDQHMHQPPSELERLVIPEKCAPEVFIEQIAQKRGGLIFPWQFTSANVPSKEFHPKKGAHLRDAYVVAVGDSVWDWLYMWNWHLLVGNWRKPDINQFYLPLKMAESEVLVQPFKKLLSAHCHRTGSYSPTIVFAASDVDLVKLTEIGKRFTDKMDAAPTAKKLGFDLDELIDEKEIELYPFPRFTQHDHVSGKKFFIKPPHPELRGKVHGKYFVDFQIEYHPQKFSYTNVSYWWKLPRLASLATCFLERGASVGRINTDGYVSACVELGKNQDIGLKIPDDRSVIYALIMQDRRAFFTDDARYKMPPPKSVYGHIRLSDEGRYLNGFIGLLENLFHAGELIENRFWRRTFENMCGVNTKNEAEVLGAFKNKISRQIPSWAGRIPQDDAGKKKSYEEMTEWLAQVSIRFARQIKNSTYDTNFTELMKLLMAERHEFTQMPAHQKGFETTPERNREDLLEALETLTTMKVLIQGIKPKCPKCGQKTWFAADRIRFELTCEGCQTLLNILPEEEWVYRLNSLVLDALRYHGTFPVAWTLSQLLDWAREGFIFLPCLELWDDYDGRKLAEVDIACIIDGQFTIGEIKTSSSEFSQEEIEKLCVVARNVLPDQIVIGALHPPYKDLNDAAVKIAHALKDIGVKVSVQHPNSQFDEPAYNLHI